VRALCMIIEVEEDVVRSGKKGNKRHEREGKGSR
jgi:hypothetical protein